MASVDEWVEVAGPTVDLAVTAALQELGLTSHDDVTVEVIQEPSKGILGTAWRAQDAVVKVTPKPKEPKKRRRRRKRRSGEAKGSDGARTQDKSKSDRSQGQGAGGGRSGGGRSDGGKNGGNRGGRAQRPRKSTKPQPARTGDRATHTPAAASAQANSGGEAMSDTQPAATEEATIEEQATVAASFIEGLLGAFGLEGTVETEIDDDILKISVVGDQTEALVGRKGAIMQSVHEITRTVVQRKTFGAPRMRLDINGYGERRREALKIYTARQAERVLEDGGEIILEPMHPADRKVIHDAVGEIEGVESYSEGVEPHRAVVIAPIPQD